MANDPELQKLDDLAARIQKAQGNPAGKTGDNSSEAAKGSNTGYELAGTILGCLLIGWLIDRYLNTSPWGVLGMFGIGIVAGFVNVWRALNGYDQSIGLHKKNDK